MSKCIQKLPPKGWNTCTATIPRRKAEILR